MATISQYIIKEIPDEIKQLRLDSDDCLQIIKNKLSDYFDDEYSNGYVLCGMDSRLGIAIFRSFLHGI